MKKKLQPAKPKSGSPLAWRERFNPLRGLTMPRAVSLMEQAQAGKMADLQWLYASELGIEATDPDLMTIIEKTLAGVADMDWQIVTADEDARDYDENLADEQRDFLEAAYNRCDNLTEAIEHLVMSRFRGFSHLQPWLAQDWGIEHLEILPQWNMARDGSASRWAWNPEARQLAASDLPPSAILDPTDYILLENRRPVNRIALVKYVRSNLAEKDWDAYIDIYGIPGVFIIMPPDIPEGEETIYRDQAVAAAQAASGALPNGSDVKTLAEVRGMQPFQLRLEWLQKQLILAGTGGMLTSLAEPTGIGGGASGAHETVWNTIVRRVAHKVEAALNRQYDRRALAAVFPGKPCLASFSLRTRQEKDVPSAVNSIAQLASAGYILDPAQVEAETGYKVSLKPPQEPLNAPSNPQPFPESFKTAFEAFKTNAKTLNAHSPVQDETAPESQKIEGSPLAAVAAAILDGSLPWEDALKKADEILKSIDPASISGDLERALEDAMFKQAAKAVLKSNHE